MQRMYLHKSDLLNFNASLMSPVYKSINLPVVIDMFTKPQISGAPKKHLSVAAQSILTLTQIIWDLTMREKPTPYCHKRTTTKHENITF